MNEPNIAVFLERAKESLKNIDCKTGKYKHLKLRPITITRATAIGFVADVHRRLPKIQGAMWGISVIEIESCEVIGVALVGHPSRVQTTSTNEHLRVLRVAVIEGYPNACSMLYGACWRAARAMGCERMDTHTHSDEPGTSLIAAGWVAGGWTRGGEWDTPKRRRRPAVDPTPKRRWWAPGSRLADGRIVNKQFVEEKTPSAT